MIACRDAGIYDEKKGTPFYLGVKDQHLCLYCTEIRGQPTLQLKVREVLWDEILISFNMFLNKSYRFSILDIQCKEGNLADP